MKLLVVLILSFCLIQSHGQNITKPNIAGPGEIKVNSYTGNMFLQRRDLYFAGRMPIDIVFSYNSSDRNKKKGYGRGWIFNYGMQVIEEVTGVTVLRNDGRKDLYLPRANNSNQYIAPAGIFDSLVKTGVGQYFLQSKDGTKYFFNNALHKRLTRLEDRNGNALVFTYTDSLLSGIVDSAGRTIQLNYTNAMLSSVVDANGPPVRTISYQYDNGGNLIKVTDQVGHTTEYKYTANGPINTVQDKNGNVIDIVYTSSYAVSQIISCLTKQTISYGTTNNTTFVTELVGTTNQLTSYKFDAIGNLVQKSGNCCGYNMKYEYDQDKNISKITDANGNISTYTYDAKANLLSKTDPLGNVSSYSYEPVFDKLVGYKDRNGNITSFSYDSRGNLTQATYPLSVVNSFGYSSNGDLLSTTDGNGNSTTYSYNTYGNLTEFHAPLGVNKSLGYDTKSRPIIYKDPNNNTSSYTFDSLDRVVSITDPLSHVSTFLYDPNNNLKKNIDRNNNSTSYSYDALDRIVQITDPLNYVSGISYDAKGNVISRTDPNGNVNHFTYDNLNRLTTESNALIENTNYNYDAAGNIIAVFMPNGNTINISYDKLNRVKQFVDKISPIYSYDYDKVGNLTGITDAIGHTKSLGYDALNRRIINTDPIGNSEIYTYDKNFNLVAVKDRNNGIRSFSYDLLNRRKSFSDQLNHITNFVYDPASNLTSVTDANGNTTAYMYNSLNLHTKVTFADGSTNALIYDPEEHITNFTDGNGTSTNFIYDQIYRLTKKDFPGINDNIYSYDAGGRLISAVNSNASINMSYDAADRLTVESLDGKTTAYGYNIPDNTIKTTYPGGKVLLHSYDLRDRLKDISENNIVKASLLYDNVDRLSTLSYPVNGTSTTFTYDQNDRLLAMLTGPGSKLNVSYTYDNSGNLLLENKLHQPNQSVQYQYDAAMRLTNFKSGTIGGNLIASPIHQQQFNYDALGNRTSFIKDGQTTNYTANIMNAYSSISGASTATPQYDNNGNVINDGTYSYAYDSENKLLSVNGGSIAIYKYDALGRRIQKTAGTQTTNFLYSGVNEIEKRDTAGNVKGSFTFGSGIDNALFAKVNDTDYYYYKNALGSVNAIANAAGNIVERYEYEPFGKTNFFTNNYTLLNTSMISNSTLYTGRSFDSEISKFYFRTRSYDLENGRFQQRDPLGLLAGDMNLYTYVMNMPTRMLDPFGTDCEEPSSQSTSDYINNLNGNLILPIADELSSHAGEIARDNAKRAFDWQRGSSFRSQGAKRFFFYNKDAERVALRNSKWIGAAGSLLAYYNTFTTAYKWGEKPSKGRFFDLFTSAVSLGVTITGVYFIGATAPVWLPFAAFGSAAYGLFDFSVSAYTGHTIGENLFDRCKK